MRGMEGGAMPADTKGDDPMDSGGMKRK
jgi:hypothetical protein